MTLKRAGGVLCLLLGYLGGLPRVSGAEEPAFFYGNGALRYAEATGYFHYVFPCGVEDASATGSSGRPAQLAGVCWPVYAGRRLHADGSSDPARPVPGVLLVTAQVVVFIPNEKANEGVMPQLLPSEIRYSYDARQVVASMETKTGTYSFAFRGVCEGCKPGTPVIDPAKKGQLDGEYAEFRRSLKEYSAVAAEVKARSAVVNVRVGPKVEPGLDDVPEAMGLYSEMNRKLAPMCLGQARACVLQFSSYQACKKGDLHAPCGEPPICEVSCALKQSDFLSLKATVCRSPKETTSMLVPDWSEAGQRLRAAQKAYREKNGPSPPLTQAQTAMAKQKAEEIMRAINAPAGQGTVAGAVAPVARGGQMDFMGKPIDPAAACTVESGYAIAMMLASSPQGVSGQPEGTTAAGPSGGAIRVSGAVVAGNRVSSVEPVYPAVAKAAHVSGTVTLHVLITERGEVADITVVSGPALLQSAAVDAVKQWRYKPYVLNGVARKVDTVVYVNFNFGSPSGGTAAAK